MLEVLADNPFLRGLVIGVLMAAPIGAVGVMCIKRALSDGWRRAMAVGLGSACVDGLFGVVAGLGLTFISTFVSDHQTIIGVVGGAIIIAMGIATYVSPITKAEAKITSGRKRRDFAAAFMLSAANPATLLGAVGLFAALGQVNPHDAPQSAAFLIAAVFCGSMMWWLFLTSCARLFRHRFGPETLERLHRIEGAIIVVLGVLVVVALVSKMVSF